MLATAGCCSYGSITPTNVDANGDLLGAPPHQHARDPGVGRAAVEPDGHPAFGREHFRVGRQIGVTHVQLLVRAGDT